VAEALKASIACLDGPVADASGYGRLQGMNKQLQLRTGSRVL